MAKKYTNTGNKDTRSGFGAGLLEAGRKNPNIVALTADLLGSVKMDAFAKEFPERFFQCGIAEANMIGAAAGLARGPAAVAGGQASCADGVQAGGPLLSAGNVRGLCVPADGDRRHRSASGAPDPRRAAPDHRVVVLTLGR